LVTAKGDLDRVLGWNIRAQPHIRQQVDALNETAGVVLGLVIASQPARYPATR
jgi:hypothetical protein